MRSGTMTERHRTRAGRKRLVGPGTCTHMVACLPQKSAKLYRKKLVMGTKYVVVQGLPLSTLTDWIPDETAGNTEMEMKKT